MIVEKNLLTISEISEITGIKIHTLRYWEKEFYPHLAPIRTNGRQRRYDEQTLNVIKDIKRLLRYDKYTIEGAKQVLER